MGLRRTLPLFARRRITGPPQIPGKETPKLSDGDRVTLHYVRGVTLPVRRPETEARIQAVLKEYSREKRAQFLEMERRKRDGRLAMWRAIDAMPQVRRVETLDEMPDIDEHNANLDVRIPVYTHTPPIKDFNLADLKEAGM